MSALDLLVVALVAHVAQSARAIGR